ncbi:caspase-14-like [Ciona intestinalis]
MQPTQEDEHTEDLQGSAEIQQEPEPKQVSQVSQETEPYKDDKASSSTAKRHTHGSTPMGSNTNSESSDEPIDDIFISEKDLRVLSCDEKFYNDHLSRQDVYSIRHCSPKAHVLILNNYKFTGVGNDRKGAKVDGQLMTKLWKGFQCKVEVKENLTAKEMRKSLTEFSENDIHESCDFCVVIIMSHGRLGKLLSTKGHSEVCGIKGASIKINDIVEIFEQDHPHLNGKPKLIFIQSCRGGVATTGVTVTSSVTQDFMADESENIEAELIPEGSDILAAYATIEGKTSFLHTKKGSLFINAIARVFSEQAQKKHVVEMLTEVKRKVAEIICSKKNEEEKYSMQMLESQDRLRKHLYLFPGFPKQQKK